MPTAASSLTIVQLIQNILVILGMIGTPFLAFFGWKYARDHGIIEGQKQLDTLLQARLKTQAESHKEQMDAVLQRMDSSEHKLKEQEDAIKVLSGRVQHLEEENERLREDLRRSEDNRFELLQENRDLHKQVNAQLVELRSAEKKIGELTLGLASARQQGVVRSES